MTDPKDELKSRFDERRPDRDNTDSEEEDNTKYTDNTDDTGYTNKASSTSKPGPDRDENATRHRKQVPMYLADDTAQQFNQLYEQLDGRSKVAGKGGIEKHADFMEAVVALAIGNEDELAEQLGITIE
ncbi:hypothetical protein [Halorubrum trueperi]|uniref:Uncharacterized protein n=1 Tax=Halorubrum trueperi TaxID=2004704 RepID=A0ABD5UKI5_9EURY